MSLTGLRDIRREASWEENCESNFGRVGSKAPWGTQGPSLEVIYVPLKLKPEVRTGNKNRRALNVQAGVAAMNVVGNLEHSAVDKRLEAELP